MDFQIEDGVLIRYSGHDSHVVIPEGVRGIGQTVFMQKNWIESVTLPEGLERIAYCAFQNCTGLRTINIPKTVQVIGEAAFKNCCNLREITIPEGTWLGHKAFKECVCLADRGGFVIRNQMLFDYLGPGGFVTIPQGVRVISQDAFWMSKNVSRVTMPDSVEEIGKTAFYACENLREVRMNPGLRKIGERAFSMNRVLQSAPIPDSVTAIGIEAFYGCRSLADAEGFVIAQGSVHSYVGQAERAVIPDSVHSIGMDAFCYNETLRELIIPDSVTAIGKLAFRESKLSRLQIPAGVTNLEKVWPDVLYHCKPEVLRAPGRSLKSLKPHHSAAAVGYAELVSEGQVFPEELEQEYLTYIKSQRKRLYPTAVRYPGLLRYMTDRRIIPLVDVEQLLSLAEGQPEILAMLLQYGDSFDLREKSRAADAKLRIPTETAALRQQFSTKKRPDGTLMITSWKGTGTEIQFPEQIGSFAVTAISANVMNRCQRYRNVKEIYIPTSIRLLEGGAFIELHALERVTLPRHLESQAENAFHPIYKPPFTWIGEE